MRCIKGTIYSEPTLIVYTAVLTSSYTIATIHENPPPFIIRLFYGLIVTEYFLKNNKNVL